MRINFVKIYRDSGSKNRGSSLQKYQSFSYSIGDACNAKEYKLPPTSDANGNKYRKNI